MSHWFDRMVKGAAAAAPSRRDAFTFGAGSAVSGMLAVRALARPTQTLQGHVLDRPDLQQPASSGACVVSSSAQKVVAFDFTTTYQDLTLRNGVSFDRGSRTKTVTMTVSRGSTPILDLQADIGVRGQITASFVYGQGVQGVANARMTSSDGRIFEGVIDGRAFSSSRPRSVAELRFADGAPAPQVALEPTLQQQVSGLAAQLQARGVRCGRATTSRQPFRQGVSMRPGSARLPGEGMPGGPPRGADPIVPNAPDGYDASYPAGDYEGGDFPGGDDCDGCHNTCGDHYKTCWGNVLLDAFTCGPCSLVTAAGCAADGAICLEGCYTAGAGCCPVGCGNQVNSRYGVITFVNCCAPNETCSSQANGGRCCQQGHLVCGSQCCESGITSCAPNGGCGCPNGLAACGNGKCCPPGKVCCGDDCCDPGQCRNNQCCASFCGDTCCPPLNACCNGVCCPGGATCVNGRCCPQGQACGSACCAAGANCLDARNSVCGTTVSCRADLQPCRSQVGAGFTTVCCPRPSAYFRPNIHSGPVSITCCEGQCCAPNQVCCYNPQAGQMGCWNANQCGSGLH